MAIALDAGFPAAFTGTTQNTRAVTISTAGTNRLLIAYVFYDSAFVSIAGGGLTWNLLQTGGINYRVYWAWAAATLTTQTITATFGTGANIVEGIQVWAWSGSQNMAPNKTHVTGSTGSAALVTVTPLGTGSQTMGLGWQSGTGTTAAHANNINEGFNLVTARWLNMRYNTLTTVGTPQVLGNDNTVGAWAITGIEIFDAAYVPSTTPRTFMSMGIGK